MENIYKLLTTEEIVETLTNIHSTPFTGKISTAIKFKKIKQLHDELDRRSFDGDRPPRQYHPLTRKR